MFHVRKPLLHIPFFIRNRPPIVVSRLNSTLPESSSVSLLNKWINFWKVLLDDYKEVFLDIGKGFKNRPGKSVIYCSIVGFISCCCSLNPDETDYRECILKGANEILFVSEAVQNAEAKEYLDEIEWLYNCGEIERINLGICSIILRSHKNNALSLFKYNCSYVQPTYLEILQNHVIDLGFWNKWWNLEKVMRDYDINPNEWK